MTNLLALLLNILAAAQSPTTAMATRIESEISQYVATAPDTRKQVLTDLTEKILENHTWLIEDSANQMMGNLIYFLKSDDLAENQALLANIEFGLKKLVNDIYNTARARQIRKFPRDQRDRLEEIVILYNEVRDFGSRPVLDLFVSLPRSIASYCEFAFSRPYQVQM